MLNIIHKLYNWVTGLKKYHAIHIAGFWSLCSILFLLHLFCTPISIDESVSSAGRAFGILIFTVFVLIYCGLIISFFIELVIFVVFLFTHKHPKVTSKFLLHNKFYNIIFLAGFCCLLFLIIFLIQSIVN